MAGAPDARAPARDGAYEGLVMSLHRLRNPLIWSPLAAIAAQLVLAAAVSAATGGGDFPRS